MVQKDIGFVLRRYNFRETSLIVTIYTSRFGKIKGILKGFYSGKKEFSSHMDMFSLNEFVFYPKKSEIWLISYADLVSDYSFLGNSISKARIGASLFNIADKTMQLWDKNHYIFNLIYNCLSLLGTEKESKVFYIFLIKFLTFSGFKPELNHCIVCQDLLKGEFLFSVSRGGLICRNCDRKGGDARRISKQASRSFLYIQNTEFPLVCRLSLTSQCEKEIFYILKEFISYHFEFNSLVEYKMFGLESHNSCFIN